MKSTNYYIVHKTGRKVKISCIGFMYNNETREQTRKMIAKIEHGRIADYRIEEEKSVEHNQMREEFIL